MIRSLYFHNPSVEGFERLIKHFSNRGYSFLSIEQLFKHIENKDYSGRLVFVSLDDGWRGNMNLLPVIEKFKIPITIFVSTEPIQSGNFWWEYVIKDSCDIKMFEFKKMPYKVFCEQLHNMKKKIGDLKRSAITYEDLHTLSKHPLVSIQSHTVNHPILTQVPDSVLMDELRISKLRLEELIGKEVFAFSYPNGSLSQREIDATKQFYKMAFSTEQNNITTNSDIFLLPRYALTGDYFKDLLKVYGIWKYIRKFFNFFR